MGVSEIARLVNLNPRSISRALAAIADSQLAQQVVRDRYDRWFPSSFGESIGAGGIDALRRRADRARCSVCRGHAT
jgi:hypothetical protein